MHSPAKRQTKPDQKTLQLLKIKSK